MRNSGNNQTRNVFAYVLPVTVLKNRTNCKLSSGENMNYPNSSDARLLRAIAAIKSKFVTVYLSA